MELFRKIFFEPGVTGDLVALRIRRPVYAGICLLSVVAAVAAFVTAFSQYQANVLFKSSESLSSQRNYPAALSEAERGAALSPHDGYLKFQVAASLYLQGNFSKAIPVFESALPMLPHSYNAIRLLGFSYYALQKYETAAKLLDQYLYMNPDPAISPELVFRMAGLSKLRLGNLADASYSLLQACRYSEDKGDILRIRSMIAVLINEPWTAEYCYQAFRQFKPEAPYNPLELVSNAIIADKLSGAIQFLKLAHHADPEDLSIVKALAAAYGRSHQVKEAIELVNTSVKQHPDDSELRLTLGDLYFNSKQYKQAFEQYDEHLRLEPKSQYRRDILTKKATSHF